MRHKTQDSGFRSISLWVYKSIRLLKHGLIDLLTYRPIDLFCVLRLVSCVLYIALIAWINPEADKTREGNRLYNKNLYDEAMTKYTEVLVDSPNSPHIHFNIGNAAYKKENYEEAIKSYAKAASLAADTMLESKAYYNLGNCKYRQGRLKEKYGRGLTPPLQSEAVSLYREALDYYKQALDKNPKDANAKFNHEFVERKIKELLDKQKQQQQQNQEQSGDRQERQDKDQAAQAQPEAQEKQKEEQESERKEGLTAEEAKMLLDSLRDEELSQLQTSRDRRSFPQVLKDW